MGLRRLRPKIRFESCNASDVYMGAPAAGNSRAHAPPRYGRIWPRSHKRGTCITQERLIECRMGQIVNFRRARKAGRAAARRASSICKWAAAWTQPSRARTRNQARRQGPPRSRPPPDRNGRRAMKSPVVKRSIVIAGHKTSVSLEDAFWKGLKEIASGRDMTLSDLVAA